MADDLPWFTPNHLPPVAPSTKPRERVWALRSSVHQGSHWIDCEVVGHGADGWECVLLKDGEWFFGRRFATHDEALNEAEELKARYVKDGGVELSL